MNPSLVRDRSRSISSATLAGVRLRQPEAWNRFVDVWGPIVYGWCRQRGIQATDAADIVQEVLVQVWRKAPEFERETFRGWISTLVSHKIADYFRARERRPMAIGGSSANRFIQEQPGSERVNSDDDLDRLAPMSSDSAIVRQVLKAIRRDFEKRTFLACWRTKVDGLLAAEAADELGMTVPAVRQATCRVLKRLREELERTLSAGKPPFPPMVIPNEGQCRPRGENAAIPARRPCPRRHGIRVTTLRVHSHSSLLLALLSACLLLPGLARADAGEDFAQIDKQCWVQIVKGNYREAERLALELQRMAEGPLVNSQERLAGALNTLAAVHCYQGRYAKAEPLFRRSLSIGEKVLGPDHPQVADSLNNLAILCWQQGRCAEAEPLLGRSLAMREKILGPDHPSVADSLNNLALLYWRQGRCAEAEPLHKRSLGIREKTFGPDHPHVADSLNNLAALYRALGRYAEAEPLYERSLALWEKILGPDHPNVARSLNNLAALACDRRRYAEAERLYGRSLTILEKALGPEHPDVATELNSLGLLYCRQRRYAEAEPLIDRTIKIYERAGGAAADRARSYSARADVHWAQKRQDAAVADLREAMKLAEQVRAQASGGEHERATTFAGQVLVFEKMVARQCELHHILDALEALERSRARGLLDQMEIRGLDLLAGVPDKEAQELRQRETRAQGRLADLQRQRQVLESGKDFTTEQGRRQSEQLVDQLRQAQRELAQAYAAIRNASPAYRLAVGKVLEPVTAPKLQSWVAAQNALLLEYLAGSEGGYVLIVPPEGKPRLERLALDESHAKALGADAGPLTGQRLSKVLSDEKGTGVLDQLSRADSIERAQAIAPALAVLWETLIPEKERRAILDGKYRRLIVLPDGPMAKLPFETLVVRAGDRPEYLLDVGPAILYAPSATILMNLAERNEQGGVKDPGGREPVLTVGDCRYGQPSRPEKDLLAQRTPPTRHAGPGGRLGPLPNSATEVRWVAEVFNEKGIKAARLKGEQATESAVRLGAPGRRVLHFACHGLVDENCGSLFGALALTPGEKQDNPADDGFLTLAEVSAMNLKGCELAILSACDTNVGPQQRGEGLWALSRGFLVAGARRVVASNWLVDDEAAPSFVSYFTSILAKAQHKGDTPDYAQAVRDARLFLRRHPNKKWNNPYYWGTFVLIGPK
jgi:RNA polymerase sigma factor (sigma-70 family)